MKPFLQWGALLPLGAALAGCGGGNGGIVTPTSVPTTIPTTTPTIPGTLTGKQAIRAVMTSGYQTYQASVNYPFSGLQLALPPTSPFKKSQTSSGASKSTRAVTTPQFNASLGLYVTSSTSGNTVTIHYYSDAAGTKSAGTSTLTAPNGSTVGGNYSSYPAVIQIQQNVTGGNIPCIGSGTITIADSKGKNSIKGTLNLPKTGLKITADLSLSDAGQVGGTATIVGNGQTITLTNLSGDFLEDWTGNARVAPDGSTGTATINVFTGKFVVNLNTKDGIATSSSDSSGALNITFPDKVGEKLLSPLSIVAGQSPDSTTPTSTPQPTTTPTGSPTSTPTPTATPTTPPTGSPLYQVPVQLTSGVYPRFLNNKNQIAGVPSTTGQYGVAVLASPTASLQTPQSSSNVLLIDFNNNGAIIGRNYGDGNLTYWPSPTATPQSVPSNLQTLAYGLSDTGAFVGSTSSSGSDGLTRSQALYWKDATTAPVTLKAPAGEDLTRGLSVNAAGQIGGVSGVATKGISVPVFWASSTATPQKLKLYTGAGYDFDIVKVNARGNILVTSNEGTSAYYSSPTAQPVVLPNLTSVNHGNVGGARSINAGAVVVGNSYNTAGNRAVRWINGQVQDLNSLIPSNSGWVLEQALSINDSGAIVGTGSLNGRFGYFYMAPRQ